MDCDSPRATRYTYLLNYLLALDAAVTKITFTAFVYEASNDDTTLITVYLFLQSLIAFLGAAGSGHLADGLGISRTLIVLSCVSLAVRAGFTVMSVLPGVGDKDLGYVMLLVGLNVCNGGLHALKVPLLTLFVRSDRRTVSLLMMEASYLSGRVTGSVVSLMYSLMLEGRDDRSPRAMTSAAAFCIVCAIIPMINSERPTQEQARSTADQEPATAADDACAPRTSGTVGHEPGAPTGRRLRAPAWYRRWMMPYYLLGMAVIVSVASSTSGFNEMWLTQQHDFDNTTFDLSQITSSMFGAMTLLVVSPVLTRNVRREVIYATSCMASGLLLIAFALAPDGDTLWVIVMCSLWACSEVVQGPAFSSMLMDSVSSSHRGRWSSYASVTRPISKLSNIAWGSMAGTWGFSHAYTLMGSCRLLVMGAFVVPLVTLVPVEGA